MMTDLFCFRMYPGLREGLCTEGITDQRTEFVVDPEDFILFLPGTVVNCASARSRISTLGSSRVTSISSGSVRGVSGAAVS